MKFINELGREYYEDVYTITSYPVDDDTFCYKSILAVYK